MFYNGIFISETSPRECENGARAWREPLRALANPFESRGATGGSGVLWVKTLMAQGERPIVTEQHLQHSKLHDSEGKFVSVVSNVSY